MPPKLRTINYTKSTLSDAMDLAMKISLDVKNKQDARLEREGIAATIRQEKLSDREAAKQLSKETTAQALKDRTAFAKTQGEIQKGLQAEKIKLEGELFNTKTIYDEAKSQRENLIKNTQALEDNLLKFGLSQDELVKSDSLSSLANDIKKNTENITFNIENNNKVRLDYFNALRDQQAEVMSQANDFDKITRSWSGLNKVLSSKEYEKNIIIAQKPISEGGLGLKNTWGLDYAFSQKGSRDEADIRDASATIALKAPIADIISSQSIIIKEVLTVDPADKDSQKTLIKRINKTRPNGIKLNDNEEELLGLLTEIASQTSDPFDFYNNVMELKGTNRDVYKFAKDIMPVAFKNLESNVAKYELINSDYNKSVEIEDGYEAFKTKIQNINQLPDLFSAFKESSNGLSVVEQQELFTLVEEHYKEIVTNPNTPQIKHPESYDPTTGDLGFIYDDNEKNKPKPKDLTGNQPKYLSQVILEDLITDTKKQEDLDAVDNEKKINIETDFRKLFGKLDPESQEVLTDIMIKDKPGTGDNRYTARSFRSNSNFPKFTSEEILNNLPAIRGESINTSNRFSNLELNDNSRENFRKTKSSDNIKEIMDLLNTLSETAK